MAEQPRADLRGLCLFDLTPAEYRSLPIGTECAFRQGIYAGEYRKIARDRFGRSWVGDEVAVEHPPWGSRITAIPGLTPRLPPPALHADTTEADQRAKARRDALERIASGRAGASESEVESARRELERDNAR